jgi:hypothetical protein
MVRKPAEAERFRIETMAEATAKKLDREAFGQAEAEKREGFARAYVVPGVLPYRFQVDLDVDVTAQAPASGFIAHIAKPTGGLLAGAGNGSLYMYAYNGNANTVAMNYYHLHNHDWLRMRSGGNSGFATGSIAGTGTQNLVITNSTAATHVALRANAAGDYDNALRLVMAAQG